MNGENNSENINSLREALVVLAVNCMRTYILELKEASDENDQEKTDYLLRKDSIETIAALAYVGSKEFKEMMKTRLGVDVESEEMEKRTEAAGKRFAHAMALANVMAGAVEKFHHENSEDKE